MNHKQQYRHLVTDTSGKEAELSNFSFLFNLFETCGTGMGRARAVIPWCHTPFLYDRIASDEI